MPAPTMQISVRDEARSPSESSSIGSPQTGSFLTCFSGIELSFRCARAGERSGLSLELVRWICPQAVCRTGSLRQEFAGENDRGGIRTHTPLTGQGILSPRCLPFHHAVVYRITCYRSLRDRSAVRGRA